ARGATGRAQRPDVHVRGLPRRGLARPPPVRGAARRALPPHRDVARRLVRGPRRLRLERHGGRDPRGLRAARRDPRGTLSNGAPPDVPTRPGPAPTTTGRRPPAAPPRLSWSPCPAPAAGHGSLSPSRLAAREQPARGPVERDLLATQVRRDDGARERAVGVRRDGVLVVQSLRVDDERRVRLDDGEVRVVTERDRTLALQPRDPGG